MKHPHDQVLEFHERFEMPIDGGFTDEILDRRWTLINEEVDELFEEFYPTAKEIDHKKMTKELADVLYVVYGTAIELGLPLKEVFDEVHRSNMTKLGEDGKPIKREDGKTLKGPNYKEPDLDQYF